MKILIADSFPAEGIARLEQLKFELISQPDVTAEELPATIQTHQPDVLIVRSTKVRAAAIEQARNLKLIVRAGAGYDNIDLAAASANGISVATCPGKNSVAVAEVAWGLILTCDRRIADQHIDLKAGRWKKGEYSKARGLKGRTLGIVGLGQIGMEIARRGQAFGMKIIAWSRSLDREKAGSLGIEHCPDLLELARNSDVISVSVAANPSTNQLINAPFVEAMKPAAILINTSRGSVVDQQALAAAVTGKGVRLGLDVFEHEPPGNQGEFADPIIQLPGVYGTQHVGASTDQAQEAIATEAVRVIRRFAETGEIDNCVNLAEKTPATLLLTVRHKNRPGVLAHIFRIIGEAAINVETMENIIFEGAEAATARIQLDGTLSAADLALIGQNPHVLAVECCQI
jgi:D-3-phosphoglycerate dehydrogenase